MSTTPTDATEYTDQQVWDALGRLKRDDIDSRAQDEIAHIIWAAFGFFPLDPQPGDYQALGERIGNALNKHRIAEMQRMEGGR